jgi:hypothetical protein
MSIWFSSTGNMSHNKINEGYSLWSVNMTPFPDEEEMQFHSAFIARDFA